MGLKHIILGLLVQKPRSAYSMHRMFVDNIKPELSQIYRALDDMAKAGYVEYDKVYEPRKPARKLFRITEAGRNELGEWIKEVRRSGVLKREPFILRLWFGGLMRKEDQVLGLQVYIEEVKREIEWCKSDARINIESMKKKLAGEVDRLCLDLSLDYILQQTECELMWAESALQKINNLYHHDTKSGIKGRTRKGGSRKGNK